MIFRSTDRLVIRNSGLAVRAAPLVAESGGWWDILTGAEGAWEGALAASQAASYVDLTGNGNDLTARTGTVNWASGTGWSNFAADTSVLYTGIDAPGEDKAIMVQFADMTANGARIPMGCASPLAGNTSFAVMADSSSAYGANTRSYITAGAAGSRTGVITSGTMALCGGQPYLNGATDGSTAKTATQASGYTHSTWNMAALIFSPSTYVRCWANGSGTSNTTSIGSGLHNTTSALYIGTASAAANLIGKVGLFAVYATVVHDDHLSLLYAHALQFYR